MKKSMMLIILILMNYNCFSQKDTTKKAIILNEKVTRLVVKDLITLDKCQDGQNEMKNTISLMEQKDNSQLIIIDNLQQQKTALESVVIIGEGMEQKNIHIINNLEKSLKKSDRKAWWYKYLFYISIVAVSITSVIR